MNIEVIGRIRPAIHGEGAENLIVEGGQRIAARPSGPYLNTLALHRQDVGNVDVFRDSIEPLLDLYMAGFNVCVLVMGPSSGGKTYSMAGESSSKAGFVPMIFDYLFSRLSEDRYMQDTRVKRQNPVITMQMYEVYNELIKDLLQVPGGGTAYLDVSESPEKGTYVRNGSVVAMGDSSDATTQFRQGLARRTESSTDYGPAQAYAATLVHVDLQMAVGENPHPNKSRFTVVELPGLERLADDAGALRQKEGPALSKSLIALNQVVTSLSSNPYPDRVINYNDSKLTQLLRDELGGNCKTRGLLCLSPQTDPTVLSAILQFANRVTQVKNYPVINDSFAQQLITQYRARIIDIRQQSGVGPSDMSKVTNINDVKETIRQLETENLKLKDDNERLRQRMNGMQQKFGNLANTKTNLSQELLLSEEDKLKVSQSLVDMQIENNKIREEAEATKFELTNKILMLENSLMQAESERDRQLKAARNSKERLGGMEKDRKDLADEYVVLKTNYLALKREHDKELKRNEELGIELLNLVNAKASLMRQIHALSDHDPGLGDPEAEISRVKAIVIQNSSGNIKTDEILGTQRDRESVEHTLFANKRRHEGELDRLRKDYGDDKSKYENRTSELMKELDSQRKLTRDRQRKIAELNASVITVRGEKEQLEVQVNRLQHKVKDLGEDYRSRLVKYVEDISEYVDRGSGMPDHHGRQQDSHMREYVDSMLKDVTNSHKDREEQLSLAAQQYREGKRKLIHKYEELLIAYRSLRLQCEQRGLDDIDMGPDEHQLNISDTEIQSAHLREISRLKSEATQLKSDLDTIKTKYGISIDEQELLKPGERPAETWAQLRKQLREYTLNTQQQLEEERARLISENAVLGQQLRESQDYIDNHLVRYKQEILKLRKMLGQAEDDTLVMGGGLTERSTKGKRRH